MTVAFAQKSWDDYNYWLEHGKKIFERLRRLIKETLRDPYGGIGKPEPLKNNLKGYWSKRINDEHRLVYKIEDQQLVIISCRFYY